MTRFLGRYTAILLAVCTSYFILKWIRSDLSTNATSILSDTTCTSQPYTARIFSLDPLIIHLSDFISQAEAQDLIRSAEGGFAPSQRVDPRTGKAGGVDTTFRKAETSFLKDTLLTQCIKQRAIDFQGHISGARVEQLQVVRYHVDNFVRNHFDWFSQDVVERLDRFGKRDTTFFFYLHANCTGGGTNFPLLRRPLDNPDWCDVIDCTEPVEGGVTFKAISRTGVFWQNWYVNNTPRYDVLHSGVPIKTGAKIGLNLWTSAPRSQNSGHDQSPPIQGVEL